MRHIFYLFLIFSALLLNSCSSTKSRKSNDNYPHYMPANPENACSILNTHPTWRQAFIDTYKKYGVPPHVIMAIMYQESTFKHNALSSSMAYGYPQAKDATWKWYQDSTGNHNYARDHLPDSVDFMGWYLAQNHRRTNVSKWDAKTQYFGYHDGTGGFLRGTHLKKKWLLKTAIKVGERSARYREQLSQCFQYPDEITDTL